MVLKILIVLMISVAAKANQSCETLFSNTPSRELIAQRQKETLRTLFPARKYDPKAVARQLGVTEDHWLDIRGGGSRLSLLQAIRISKMLEISIWDVIGFISEFTGSRYSGFPSRYYGRTSVKYRSIEDKIARAQAHHLRYIQMALFSNITQTDISERMGISGSMVWHYFSGEVFLSLDRAIQMANVLEVDAKLILAFLEDFDGA